MAAPTLRRIRKQLSRLVRMERAELLDRLRQETSKHLDTALGGLRYRDLEVGDIPEAPGRSEFFFSTETAASVLAFLRERLPDRAAEIVRYADRICSHRFDLLGYAGVDYGEEIDWHCDRVHAKTAPRVPFHRVPYLNFDVVGDAKVTWELNRHQHFVSLAQAYRLTGDVRFSQEIFRQWRSWHDANPYPAGINWASSLEVAFRSLSWLWMYFLLRDTPAATRDFQFEVVRSLGINARHIARYLSTYSSPNTHLLGEGVALFFIGTLCGSLRDAARWKETGWGIVLREAERQVRDDGMHIEQSTYYHVYALDFLLHATILAARNGMDVPTRLLQTIEKMLDVLCRLGQAGLPRLGDDDGGRVFDGRRNRSEQLLDPLATGAVLFERAEFKHAARDLTVESLWLLGESGPATWDRLISTAPSAASHAMKESGIYVMSREDGVQRLVIDAGPRRLLRSGHWHANALSICLRSGATDLLVDPGTFAYTQANGTRSAFRSTRAHNTLQIDGCDQAEQDGPFTWGSLPNVRVTTWIAGDSFDLFAGSHDGYRRLEDRLVHRRTVFSLRSHLSFVRDVVDGAGVHRIDQHWHLSPQLNHRLENRMLFYADNGDALALVPPAGHAWDESVQMGSCSPVYGSTEPALVARFSTQSLLPAEFAVLLIPVHLPDGPVGTLRRVESGASVYRYCLGPEEYLFCFNDRGGQWTVESCTSDAEFVCQKRISGNVDSLVMCNGTFVESDGFRIETSGVPVKRCEADFSGAKPILSSSEPELVSIRASSGVTWS